jgi:hypothetical protein
VGIFAARVGTGSTGKETCTECIAVDMRSSSRVKSLKKMACLMEKEICTPLESFTTAKTRQLAINREHRRDLDELLKTSHEILQEVRRK